MWAMRHPCGGYFSYPEGLPSIFFDSFYRDKICPKCGQDMGPSSLTKVKGYFKSTVVCWNPLTWFTSEFVEILEYNAEKE